MQELLRVEGLTAGYGDVQVVRNVDFSLTETEILGIVGESGCGKSTLLKAVAQITGLNTEVMDGRILFGGRDLSEITKKEKQQMLGSVISFVFQNSGASLHPTKKIINQFYETAQAHTNMTKEEVETRMLDIFTSIGLRDGMRIMNAYPFELSGGMAQRVAIALAVFLKPKLILADEPTSALDTTIQKQVIEELLLLRERMGTAMIVITHNIGVVAKMADKVGVMYGGRMVEYGPTKEVLENPQHPYTRALLSAVPKLGGELPVGLKGRPPRFDELGNWCAFKERCPYAQAYCDEYHNEARYITPNHYVICHREDIYE